MREAWKSSKNLSNYYKNLWIRVLNYLKYLIAVLIYYKTAAIDNEMDSVLEKYSIIRTKTLKFKVYWIRYFETFKDKGKDRSSIYTEIIRYIVLVLITPKL